MSLHCSICGACFCPPTEDLLLSYLPLSSSSSRINSAITEEETTWLSRFRLLVQIPPPDPPPSDERTDDAAPVPPTYALSGPGRIRRQSRAEFTRGDLFGRLFDPETTEDGAARHAKGPEGGADELLSLGLSALARLAEAPQRRGDLSCVIVHRHCYEGTLLRVLELRELSGRRSMPEESGLRTRMDPLDLSVLYSCLRKQGMFGTKQACGIDGKPPEGIFGTGMQSESARAEWAEKRQVRRPDHLDALGVIEPHQLTCGQHRTSSATRVQPSGWQSNVSHSHLIRTPRALENVIPLTQHFRYSSNWPLFSATKPSSTITITRRPHPNAPFTTLPTDCIPAIGRHPSVRAIALWSKASPHVSCALSASDFWFQRIRRDMPWLAADLELCVVGETEDADAAAGAKFAAPAATDWRAVYFDLLSQGVYEAPARELGVVNRKRIWGICVNIVEVYRRRVRGGMRLGGRSCGEWMR